MDNIDVAAPNIAHAALRIAIAAQKSHVQRLILHVAAENMHVQPLNMHGAAENSENQRVIFNVSGQEREFDGVEDFLDFSWVGPLTPGAYGIMAAVRRGAARSQYNRGAAPCKGT